jgi:hypothetical protein
MAGITKDKKRKKETNEKKGLCNINKQGYIVIKIEWGFKPTILKEGLGVCTEKPNISYLRILKEKNFYIKRQPFGGKGCQYLANKHLGSRGKTGITRFMNR